VSRIRDLHRGWMKDAEYRQAYDALEGELALAAALIRARSGAGLTQEQLAARMGTKQEVVARWEGGKMLPSTRTLARLAKATGTTLRISFTRLQVGRPARRPRRQDVARAKALAAE
jgi:transcriptional regulator with XRE-family HTH domain